MATQSTIEVTLAANTGAFSTKIKEASENIKGINKDFSDLGKKVDGIEGRLGTFGDKVTGASQRFNGLGRNMASFAESLKLATSSLQNLTKNTASAQAGAQGLTVATGEISKAIAAEISQVLRLGAVQKQVGDGAVQQARESSNAKNKAIKDELSWISSVNKALDKEAFEYKKLGEAAVAYRDRQNKLAQEGLLLINQEIAARERLLTINRGRERNVGKAYSEAFQENLIRSNAGTRIQNGEESYRQAVAEDFRRDAAIRSRIGVQQQADKDEATRKLSLARELANGDKNRHHQQMTMFNEQANLLRGMAQLWVASKIERGLANSIHAGAESEMIKVRVSSLNLGSEAESKFYAGAQKISKESPNISQNDAMKVQLAGVAGAGKFDPAILDVIMPTVAKMAANMATLFGDANHKIENSARNIFGIFEMMGAAGNPERMKEIANATQRAILASGGKLSVQDFEIEMRRLGMGNAPQRSVDSIFNAAAFMNQMKISGGSGGGANGASTVGVVERQILQVIDGGMLGKGGGKSLGSFMDLGWADSERAKSGDKSWRDNKDAHKDTFLYLSKMAEEGIAKIVADPKLRDKYFQAGEDANNKEDQKAMYTRLINNTVLSANNKQVLVAAGLPDVQKRMHDEANLAKGSDSVDDLDKKMSKTYTRNVENLSAAFVNLKTIIGADVLPVVTELVKGLTNFITATTSFAKDNPLSVQMISIGAAIGGVVISLRGVISLFGLAGGGIIKTFSALVPGILGAGTATTTAGAQATASMGAWSALTGHMKGHFTAVGGHWSEYLSTVRTNVAAGTIAAQSGSSGMGIAFGAIGRTAVSTASLVAKSFLRMIPLVGELLLAWDFAELLSHVKVGGHEIGAWMGKWLANLLSNAEIYWLKFKAGWADALGFKDKAARLTAEAHELELQQKRDDAANGFGAGEGDADAPKPNQVKSKSKSKGDKPVPSKTSSDEPLDESSSTKHKLDDSINEFLASKRKLEQLAQLKLDLETNPAISKEQSYQKQGEADVIGTALEGKFDHAKEYGSLILKAKDEYEKAALSGVGLDQAYAKFSKIALSVPQLADAAKVEAFTKKNKDDKENAAFLAQTLGRVFGTDNEESDGTSMVGGLKLDKKSAEIRKRMSGHSARFGDTEKVKEYAGDQVGGVNIATLATTLEEQQSLIQKIKLAGDKDSARLELSAQHRAELMFDNRTKAEQQALEKQQEIVKAAYERTVRDAEDVFQKEMQDASISADKKIALEEWKNKKILDAYAAYAKKYKLGQDALNEYLELRLKQRVDAVATPLEEMTNKWKRTDDNIAALEATWGNSLLDTMHKFTTTGKLDWRNFLTGMTSDISKLLLKDALADPINKLFSGFGGYLKDGISAIKSFGKPSVPGATASVQDATASASANIPENFDWGTMSEGVKDFTAKIGDSTGAVGSMTKSVADTIVQDGLELTGTTTKITAEASATASLTALATAASLASESLGGTSSGGLGGLFGGSSSASAGGGSGYAWDTMSGFANGGIMSVAGKLPLNMYASGGIANSAQMAIFGEGRMNEAYVPLPDGRSIPVTMSGGKNSSDTSSGNLVNISIVVNSDGTGVKSSQSGDGVSAWSAMSNKIKGVVVEELISQKRPGGLLYA